MLFAGMKPGAVISEDQLKLDVWGDSVVMEKESCGVGVRALLRLTQNLGCPAILEREYRIGWRRTSVPIVVLNAPTAKTRGIQTLPEPEGVDLLFAHLAKLRSQYPWVMQTVLHKWKHARARAKEGVWKGQTQVDLFKVLLLLRELKRGEDLPDGNDVYSVCIRAEERFAWVYKELCKTNHKELDDSPDSYVPVTNRVVMNYDSWLCFGYDMVLASATDELRGSDWDAGRLMYDEEETSSDAPYPESLIELHHIATRWYPAIDPNVPYGKAVVRFS